LTPDNVGDLFQCLQKLKALMQWERRSKVEVEGDRVRAVGFSCLWKTSISPTNASSGAVVTFNQDGSVNLLCGVVEIGQGTKTVLAQILAEKLRMSADKVHVMMDVRTEACPEHWKTVASSSVYLAGNAVLRAADDALRQLKSIASIPLRCASEDVEIAGEKAYVRDDPRHWILIKDIVHGYRYPNGNTVGGQVIGRGSFVMKHLTYVNPETGEGKPGPEWTIGAQAVEVEYDRRTCTYTITKAYSVIDAGKVLNPMAARGQVMGAMSMGLSFASREEFLHDGAGGLMNNQFRSYKVLRYGENPEYVVDFVETPRIDAPFGQRGLGEQGLIGMPAALANALSAASGAPLNRLPLTPESIWKARGGAMT
jgi:CO/xanthine dehydrogenase Mo-binding subunit